MIPVLTPAEMAGVDRQAPEPVDVLVGRAGAAVARRAARLLNGAYGREITVIAGKGNNGADGRLAAKLLAADGARVNVLEAAALAGGSALPPSDLVIDAAYGTGLERPYSPPDAGRARVLAVDIPSGLSGLTGEVLAGGGAMPAVATVTFASLKPGLLLGSGPISPAPSSWPTSGSARWSTPRPAAGSWRTGTYRPCSRAGLTKRTSGRPPSRSWPARRG